MRRNILAILGLILVGVLSAQQVNSSKKNTGDSPRDKALLQLIRQGLQQAHFDPRDLDDRFSVDAFKLYLDQLDPAKRLFTAAHINQFETYQSRIDDEWTSESTEFFELTYGILAEQIERVHANYPQILAEPFNFAEKENFQFDEIKEWPADDEEILDAWRRYLKYQTLLKINELARAVHPDESLESVDWAVYEDSARVKVRKSMDRWYERMSELDRDDWFSAYLNSCIAVFDPHTNYLPPYDKKTFEIQMSGKLEGIGAQLSDRDGNITVVKVVSGSASWRQGELEVNDVILKVAQAGEDPVDIVDMRLEDAVQLIRGPKGTVVELTVKKVDGTIVVIPIERDVVILRETYARSAVLEDQNKLGYIRLPKFYLDFDGEGRDCAEDVKTELKRLQEEGVEGVVLDLRNNGGGSLKGAIDIAGLFMDVGPVVQVVTRQGGTRVFRDEDPSTIYDGPLVVLVNPFSASASEILAGALQDYDRGIILGSKHTFGKGTVQSIFEMDRMIPEALRDVGTLGGLKVTIQKFYRVNGQSTQLRGVSSDIVWPNVYNFVPFGEAETDFPLDWDEIPSSRYTEFDHWDRAIEKAITLSEKRIAMDTLAQAFEQHAQWVAGRRENKQVSLNWKQYHKDRMEADERNEHQKNLRDNYRSGISAYATETPADTVAEELQNRFIEDLEKDRQLKEAFDVLVDLKKFR